jgi:hypothetical protein
MTARFCLNHHITFLINMRQENTKFTNIVYCSSYRSKPSHTSFAALSSLVFLHPESSNFKIIHKLHISISKPESSYALFFNYFTRCGLFSALYFSFYNAHIKIFQCRDSFPLLCFVGAVNEHSASERISPSSAPF